MQKPKDCETCPLYALSDGYILSEGLGTNGVVILGESGGYNEYIDNLPFRPHAASGSKLEEVFKLVTRETGQPCTRNQFLLYNVVNCHPPSDKLVGASYEKGAIEHCSKNVDRIVGGFNTNHKKTILALGNTPLKFLTGYSGLAEEKTSISHLRGFVLESKYGLVVPSFHPSHIKRGMGHLTPLLVEDLKKAMAVAKGLYTSYSSHKEYVAPIYQTSPGLDDAWAFYNRVRDNPNLVLTYDIETDQTFGIDEDERDEVDSTDITQIQFSLECGRGIAFPFNGDYRMVSDRIFALPNIKANHNTWNFDNPRLKAKGVKIEGKIHDTMWMFKHWHPKLPRGLQSVASMFGFPFPWKHMYSSNLQWYGCADVDAVQWIIHILPKLMKARGVWEGYVNHVYRVNPILTRASEIGIPVSEEKRVALEIDFKERREKIHKELQNDVPEEIRNIRPKRKIGDGEWDYGYIREPKIVGIEFDNYKRISDRLIRDGKRVVDFDAYLYKKHSLTYAEFEEVISSTGERHNIKRWCIVEPFKASSTQMIRYLKWKKAEIEANIEGLVIERGGRNPEITKQINELRDLAKSYEVPISLKTKRETTNKQDLEEMYFETNDPVLEKVVSIRSLDTNINNYLVNWTPSKDGRVHPTYGYTAPTGQINSWRPNSQNVSKHTEFGKEFRGLIEAPSGYCFIECDKKSFHVGTMGYVANDKGYIRFSQIDPHSILGSYIDPSVIGGSISLKWSDAEIKEAAREFKRISKHNGEDSRGVDVRQAIAKPVVLGNQLGLGPRKLQRQNRRFIHSILEAERLQHIISDLFPKVERYKEQIKEKAHLDKFLIDEWGRIQYFYDVFNFTYSKYKQQWQKKEGDGARFPIAFRVQASAFGLITNELLELERLGACEEHNFIVTVHDSLLFMPEINKKDKCIEIVSRVMNTPCSRLTNEATGPEGLLIGVEVSTGKTWKNMEEIKL